MYKNANVQIFRANPHSKKKAFLWDNYTALANVSSKSAADMLE